jgi:serine/threonine protein phosphatase PrpC
VIHTTAARAAGSGNGRLDDGGRTGPLLWGFCSDAGPHRDHNEDFVGAGRVDHRDDWGRGPVYAVADGLGGHAAGEIASRLAVERIVDVWSTADGIDAAKLLRSAVRLANVAVVDASLQEGRRGMGTTITTLTLTPREVVVAHVGDTRAYRVRGDSCVQLTSDHSRVGEMLRMKLLTAAQAANHPARSQLTRSLGSDFNVQVDLVREPLEVGDTFVLCSDGLLDAVGNIDLSAAIAAMADDNRSAYHAAKQLVDVAIERGSADNVTAMVIQVCDRPPVATNAERRSRFRFGRS